MDQHVKKLQEEFSKDLENLKNLQHEVLVIGYWYINNEEFELSELTPEEQ